jgi:hypothetical protein
MTFPLRPRARSRDFSRCYTKGRFWRKSVVDQELHSPAARGSARSRTASAAKRSASRTSSASRSGYSARMPSVVCPSATRARTVATGIRRPRRFGGQAVDYGQGHELSAPSPTSSDALLKESYEYRQRQYLGSGPVRARAKDLRSRFSYCGLDHRYAYVMRPLRIPSTSHWTGAASIGHSGEEP